MSIPSKTGKTGAARWRVWLLAVAFVWQVAAVPWANDVHLTFTPLPFLMLWQMAGIVLTSVTLGVIYLLDRRSA